MLIDDWGLVEVELFYPDVSCALWKRDRLLSFKFFSRKQLEK